MNDKHVHDEPSDVEADGRTVHVQGPADIDIALTPKAALETAKRLGDAAVEALLVKPAQPVSATDGDATG